MTDRLPFGAAIFDMDGLIIDSEPLWREAEQRVFATVGIDLTDDMCRQTMGLRIDEVIRYWHERMPWQNRSLADIENDILDGMEAAIRARGAALPGVRQSIALLREHDLALAVASSSHTRLIDCVLDKLDLADSFDAVCSAGDEAAGKPDPAVYLTAARRLHMAPDRCIALEDAPAGLQAARAAGMFTVFVPERGHPVPDTPCADLTLESLEDFSMTHVLERAASCSN